jgi:transforming growth factor-beta-induced protein
METNMKSLSFRSLFAASLCVSLFACSSTDPTPAGSATPTPTTTPTTTPQGGDIVDTAVAAGNFKTLAAALGAAGLAETLKGPGPFTVFAPTDEAFAKLPPGTVDNLLKPENKAALANILTYHVVSGKVTGNAVIGIASGNGEKYVETLQGGDIKLKLITGFEGGTFLNDTIKLGKTDIIAKNGIIHVIDAVLASPPKDVIETAKGAGTFKTLVAAVEAAGLTATLQGKGPFTILAPTDAAFEALPAGTVATLLLPENKAKLTDLLKYHVMAGKNRSNSIVLNGKASTLLPMKDVDFKKVDGGTLFINNTTPPTRVTAVVDSSNGVIHVIDQVLSIPAN